MVTRAQLAEIRAGNAQLTRMLDRDLRQVWANLDLEDRDRVRAQVLSVTPVLVDRYGQISASLAAEFYDDTVGAPPRVADSLNTEKVEASARWAIGPLWEGAAAVALANLSGAAQRHALQFGRDTMHASTLSTRGVSYARVTGGNDTCEFCVSMAALGPVWGTPEAAGEGNDYHTGCMCQPVAVSDPSELPPQYDLGALQEMAASFA